ncbi:hypothetical protein KFK09_014215 [Dendrobium nobile]|uniref:Uncharacterized protein n=1 Tax=Dendrobium nobile TaxID=94219 RepID=A0A8T3BBF1_DENNO|nr:hypothetical protein KFK09_014215 [Dendrobium nobile]
MVYNWPVDMRGYMIARAGFVKGQSIIDIDTSFGLEAWKFYPEVKYASIDELLDSYL